MYLKNIEVQGFKSFAQKINFEFHNGITAIVGPNGSGKSNVADAVRWVLGEQSAKQLRGGNMQDVIFSGTETRKPLGYASVAITLDNADHRLAIDYNEVTVTRRLYRSGESEYLINGSICRLRDINEMFYDTGVGKEGYSIIGQGQIDKILSGKPEDRRELFDEAAGIVKFKRRKNQALKKLDEEQQNMVRVTDILTELTRQLGPLQRQSEAAKIYLARRDTLKKLDFNLFLVDDAYTSGQLSELNGKLDTAQNQLQDTRDQYERTREEYDRAARELEELGNRMDSLRDSSQKMALDKEQTEGRIRILQEQILASAQTDEHYRARLASITEEQKKRSDEHDSLEEEKSGLNFHIRTIRRELKEQEISLFNIQTSIEECSAAVEDGKNEIIDILNSRANTKGQVQRVDTLMEQARIREAEISSALIRLKQEEAEIQAQQQEARTAYDQVTEKIRKINEGIDELEQNVRERQNQLKDLNDRMEQARGAFHREASRLESLRNMAERYDGYGNSIRRVMEQKDRYPGIHGVVADLLQVDKKYEIAIETALGGTIQNIVTDTDETAKAMIEYLKKNRYGRATFLPLGSIRARGGFTWKDALKEKGAIGLADTLVKADKAYDELVRYLLGRILVVDTIDHAIAIARKYSHSFRMVTLEGESLAPGGSMTGGAFKNSSNLLGRKREIEELEASLKNRKKESEDLQKQIDTARNDRNDSRDLIAECQEELRKAYVEQNTQQLQLDRLENRYKEVQENYVGVRRDEEENRRQEAQIQSDRDRISGELAASEKDEKELDNYIETRQEELDGLKEQEAELQTKINETRMTAQSEEQKLSFTEENLARIESESDALMAEFDEITANLKNSGSLSEQRTHEIEDLRGEITSLEEGIKNAVKELENLTRQREELNQSNKDFFDKRDDLSGQIGLLDKEVFRLQSRIEKLEEGRESQINYLWEEYEMTPAAVREFRDESLGDRVKMKQEITKIKEEIRALGPVNVNAIEDYKELQERHGFLSAQYEDLQKAEQTLQGIIRELDEGMRRQFTEKFAEIQKEFDKAFRELFGGGKGSLELLEDEEILEAGIRIIAQPPGKKLQNMMQLSGGEKALTAIALLFAIQNLKPSPFCLLDEIEAALDDPNVGRFASYLHKLSSNTQFIVITHRRGTMNAADRLYGITMQEKGVSALVSVDLVENQLTS